MQITASFEERHPYLAAHIRFTTGKLLRAQAASMVAMDREFIAECDLAGRFGVEERLEHARAIVDGPWTAELLAYQKRSWCAA